MSDLEESIVRRLRGPRIIALSLALGFAGVLPLLLYVVFGPKDGNPIGLGLLAMLAVPVAVIGVLVGLISLAVEALVRRRR